MTPGLAGQGHIAETGLGLVDDGDDGAAEGPPDEDEPSHDAERAEQQQDDPEAGEAFLGHGFLIVRKARRRRFLDISSSDSRERSQDATTFCAINKVALYSRASACFVS